MKPDTYMQLGDMQLSRYEVPESIGFGGEQALAVHELTGGRRVVDAMGRQDRPLEWSGLFIGENASERARYLNALRIAGKQVNVSWAEFAYKVVIRSALLEYRRAYEIPYTISCTVIEDLTIPVFELTASSIDSAISDDMDAANALGDQIGDGTLSTMLGTLNSAIKSVSSFAGAAQSTITSVLGPVLAVQSRVSALIAATGNTISNISTVGGVLPNNPIATQAAKLSRQVAGFTQLPLLLNLQSTVGRMGANLGAVSGAGTSITTAGGNLFAMASKAYGDASKWVGIARANKISDPALTGVQTIIVPRVPGDTGGINAG